MISTWSSVFGRRELLGVLVMSELKSSRAKTSLGWLWWILDPLFMMVIYWFVFSKLLGFGRQQYAPFALFILCALVPWKHLSECISKSTNVLRAKEGLIRSVAFPTAILPIRIVLVGFVHLLFGFLVLLMATLLMDNSQHSGNWWTLVQAFPLMALQLVIGVGFALVSAVLGTLYRDFGSLVPHIIRVTFFLSPGIYGADLIRQRLIDSFGAEHADLLYQIYMLNPMARLFTHYRDAFFYGVPIPLTSWVALALEAAAVLGLSILLYRRFDRRLVKLL